VHAKGKKRKEVKIEGNIKWTERMEEKKGNKI
jgi:hypothetical protein